MCVCARTRACEKAVGMYAGECACVSVLHL